MRHLASFVIAGVSCVAYLHAGSETLADDLRGGYQVITCDVNGDGKQDIVALASGMPDLLWFENPTWQRHVLATNLKRMINVACWNKGPKTIPIVAIASEFATSPKESLGIVSVLTPPGDPRQVWTSTEIDRLPASHRLRWANIDGSGNKVLVNVPLADADAEPPDYRGHVPLVYYRPGDWKRQVIGTAEEGIVHGICVTDWDGNGRDDLLIGSFAGVHLYRFGKDGKWSRTAIAKGNPDPWPKSGTSDIAVGRLGKERFLATIEPWHGNKVAVYRQRNGAWDRQVIDDSLADAHTVETLDLNGDGNSGIVVGFRGKPYGVNLYQWNGTAWTRTVLNRGSIAASGCTVAALTAEAPLDVVCIGSSTHNLVLFRNPGR